MIILQLLSALGVSIILGIITIGFFAVCFIIPAIWEADKQKEIQKAIDDNDDDYLEFLMYDGDYSDGA